MVVPGDPTTHSTRGSAFASLYEAHFAAISAYALRRCSRDGAADVVSETFVVAWVRLDEVPQGAQARLWLFGVARRVLANQRRGNLRQDRLRRRLAEEFAGLPTMDIDLAGHDDLDRIRVALSRLSEDDRELLFLIGWEGLSPSEVSKVIAVPASVVRVRLHRARRKLAKLAGEDLVADAVPTRLGLHDTAVAWEGVSQ